MATRTLTLPTTSALPSAHRVPTSDPFVQRTLGRVSRPALIKLVHEWLQPHNLPTCRPVLGDQSSQTDSVYDLHQTLDEVWQAYDDFRTRKGNKREVVDRIVEGDWRDGISLRQLAMVDIQYLMEHPISQKWVALKLTRARMPLQEQQGNQSKQPAGKDQDKQKKKTTTPGKDTPLPRFEAPVFLSNLQSQIGGLLKAHYHFTHLPNLPLTLLRIAILDSPYNSQSSLQDGSGEMWRTLFVAFPDNTPYVYVAVSPALGGSNGAEGRALRNLVLDAIPKAFSRPRERYNLEATAMAARSLGALLTARGPHRSNAAGGGWSVFAKGTVDSTPLTISTTSYDNDHEKNKLRSKSSIEANTGRTRKRPLSSEEATQLLSRKRRLLAQDRFGISAQPDDEQGIDKFCIRIEDAYPISTATQQSIQETFLAANKLKDNKTRPVRASELSKLEDPSFIADNEDDTASENEDTSAKDGEKAWKPHVTITFHGTHVFAGIRTLVETGAVDGRVMPGWLTGEDGVTIGVVREGKIVKSRGDGA